MDWGTIIGQRHVVEVLQRLIEQGRVPHAFLFEGPDGCGKRAVALTLARTLQCLTGEAAPCRVCLPCKKVGRMVHPDVHVLLPYPSDTDPHEVAERLRLLAADPYRTVDFSRRPVLEGPLRASNKQAVYSIDRIRDDLLHPFNYRPLEGRYKIAILTDADVMNARAANALLKMLEEPPQATIFILTTRHIEAILPTIASRCQRLRFEPLSIAAIEDELLRREAVNHEHAAVIARMSDGSVSRALDLLESEVLSTSRDQVVEFIRRSYSMDAGRIADVGAWIAGLGREHVKAVLGLMLSWIRDLLLFRELGDQAPLVNVDQREVIARFCSRLPHADLAGMAGAVEEAVGLIERNVRADLLLPRLSFVFHHAMQGQRAERLFLPLSD